MKTPQRPFVVEIKSGRRRLTRPANSIWGNTDIKTLVLEAEAENLTERPGQTLNVNGGPVPHDIQQSSPEPVIAGGANGEQQIAASASQEGVCRRQSDDGSARVDVFNEHGTFKPKPARLGRRPGLNQVPSVVANEAVVSPVAKVVPESPRDYTDLSELALLEDENLRLKRLLAARLNAENQRPVIMV